MNDKLENKIIESLLADRRLERRWRNIRFSSFMFILLLFVILIFSSSTSAFEVRRTKGTYVSLVRMDGLIMSNTAFSILHIIPELSKAFADKNAKGVVLLINSPGGSPVQASIIRDKIIELKKQYHKKVVAIGEDRLASAAYLVSTGADKIYVNNDTLTGSIGVFMSSFGFVDTLKKIGMTRRLLVAGDHKDRLDPFQPIKLEDIKKINKVLAEVHQNFIRQVIEERGNRLHGDRQEIFSGDFWTGTKATELGIVDGTANLWTVLEQEFRVKDYKDYTTRPSFLQSLFDTTATELTFHLINEISALREQLQV